MNNKEGNILLNNPTHFIYGYMVLDEKQLST